MAEDCTDGDYLGAYSRFFAEFIAGVNPYDQLPVSVSSYNVTKAEIVGEIINVTLQYLNQTQCPASLQAHLVHQVVQEIKSMCKKQPEDCGFRAQEKTYTSLKLMQAVIAKVNEICTRYLDNSRLALLPPPPSTPLPEIAVGGSRNCKRKMEDRYMIVHDLHSTFGIQDDIIVNYYGLFDGHAGQDAAVYCATHLHQYLAESIYYPTNPERALHDAFITTDTQFVEKSKTEKVCGGTTAVCALVMNKKLYVAWVGDSSAILIKRDSIVELVNPHRPTREDERLRIKKMGGVVMQSMGVMRVNGALSVTRAIGDVRYKPFVSGEPEVKCVNLDGTEDFLVLATDGLTDYVEPAEILSILYHEIQHNPNGLKQAPQILLQFAKLAGSKDNITVIVVLLTPAREIAARSKNSHPCHLARMNDILEKMNPKDKPLFLINSNILKQAMLPQESRDHEDAGILGASNGKHENGDADYDYSDLGPESNVDAIDDVPATTPVKNLSYEFYKDNDDHRPDNDGNILADDTNVDEPIRDDACPFTDNNLSECKDTDEDDETKAREMVQDDVAEKTKEEISNEVRESFNENIRQDDMVIKEDQVEESQDAVDDAGPMDFDDSPPSPQTNKPLQHALIHEADNVADSEDSEDEWNYYRVDPNKDKDSTAAVDELQEPRNEEEVPEKSKTPVEEEIIDSKILSEDIEEDIKCERPKEDSSELINTEISAEDEAERLEEEEEKEEEKEGKVDEEETLSIEEEDKSRDMDFQLNPDAAEFVPVSPQFTGTSAMNLGDFPVSGSPFKQVSQMDDIQVPSQSEFEKEVCQRPREVDNEDKEYQNGDHIQNTDLTDYMNDRQKTMSNFPGGLDDSEISSTKAEYGDDSVSFLTATEFHRTGMSTVDESFSSSERDYDIAKDPMAMSFTPSDFEVAFDKSVDLNAVHNLSGSYSDEKNGGIEKEEGEEELMAEFLKPQLESTKMESPEDEQPPQQSVVPEEETAKLVNLSSQLEESEATFIEHTDKSQTMGEFLTLQTESAPLEHHEATKDDHSPLTENYSMEFESEKEPVSVDNEQPLSPSIADIDKTKPIDEASEDAVPLISDFQKEPSTKETDTPSSLSPVPDTMEHDLVVPTESKEDTFGSIQSSLHSDAPEVIPREQYSFQSYDVENREMNKSPIEIGDFCQKTSVQADVYEAPLTEESCVYTPYSTEAGDTFETNQNMMNLDVDVHQSEEKEVVEPVSAKPAEEHLLDFAEEEQEICVKSHVEDPLTPDLSPQEVEEKESQEMGDLLVCPMQPTKLQPDEIDLKQDPIEADVVETRLEEEIEPAKEPVMNLSESMQEFTGLENQLQPEEEKIPGPWDVPEVQNEVPQKVEMEEDIVPEKPVEPVQPVEPVVEEECKVQEKKEVEEVPSMFEDKIPPAFDEKIPSAFDEEIPSAFEEKIPPAFDESKVAQAVEVVEPVGTIKTEEAVEAVESVESVESVKPDEAVEAMEVVETVKAEEVVKAEDVAKVEESIKAPEEPEKAKDIEKVEDIVKAEEVSDNKVAETATVAVAAAAATGIVVAAASSTQSKAKPTKPATKSSKAPTSKTTTPKSTPTSPSKPAISSTRTSTTATKKPTTTATRPKDLEAPKKAAISSTTHKPATTKSVSKSATSTSTTKSTPRTSSGTATKPKPIAAPSKTSVEKKPTANGDVKPLSKPATAKPSSKTSPVSKTTLAKTSTARTSTGTTTTKARPASASTTTIKTTTTAKSVSSTLTTTTSSTGRPKTAPSVGSATKTTTRTSTAKSPMIDKQIKETANKQISMARTSTTAKTRTSTSNSSTATVKRVSSVTKTSTAASPTKKTTTVSKVTGKTPTGVKTSTDKGKVVQNGVSEKAEMNAIIDDIPKKDLSPVIGPNDNQLIMSSD